MDESIPIPQRLSYEAFVAQVRTKYTKEKVVMTMDQNDSSSSSAAAVEPVIKRSGPGKQINVVKHSNKSASKSKSGGDKKDVSKITCYACNQLGHYRGSKKCPLYDPKAKSSDKVQEVSLAANLLRPPMVSNYLYMILLYAAVYDTL
jgi:ribosomal protein L21